MLLVYSFEHHATTTGRTIRLLVTVEYLSDFSSGLVGVDWPLVFCDQ
jgi:hypothetical protein